MSSPSGMSRSERARSGGGVVPDSWYHFDEYQSIISKTYFVLYIVDEPALVMYFLNLYLAQYSSTVLSSKSTVSVNGRGNGPSSIKRGRGR